MRTFEVAMLFAEGRSGQDVMLFDAWEVEQFSKDIASKIEQLEAAKLIEIPQEKGAKDKEHAERVRSRRADIDRLISGIQEKHDTWFAAHTERIKQARKVVFVVRPFTYYERLEAEENHRSTDRDTGETTVKDDYVRDALLTQCVLSRDGEGLDQVQVRQLLGPVAARLWQKIKEVSEPNEAEMFPVG